MAVGGGVGAAPAFYDLEPMRERLPELLDFDRLNGGETRLSIAAPDVTVELTSIYPSPIPSLARSLARRRPAVTAVDRCGR